MAHQHRYLDRCRDHLDPGGDVMSDEWTDYSCQVCMAPINLIGLCPNENCPTQKPELTLQERLFQECESTGWDPDKENTFAEEITFLHAELSEAFEEWRVRKNCEGYYKCTECGRKETSIPRTVKCLQPMESAHNSGWMTQCEGLMKPEGVPYEFADVIIGLFYNAELHGFDLMGAVEEKHRFNLNRSYEKEGRRLHG